jgi:hypothetical protein
LFFICSNSCATDVAFDSERIKLMANAQHCTPAADYRTDAPRIDGWTYERQAAFLMALAQSGTVSQACAVAEMSAASAYMLRREPRGLAFQLGWHAAHLMARDRLEDVMLEAAIVGIESVSTRVDGVTRRRAINSNLSMAVLNRLDRRLAALDDDAVAAARSIGAAFDDFIALILAGGGADDVASFLDAHPDPLASQVAEARQVERAGDGVKIVAPTPQLVEKSAIFMTPPTYNRGQSDAVTPLSLAAIPCACPADRDLARLEAV